MANANPQTILLETNGELRPVYNTRIAATATIIPGMLIEIDANGKVTPVASADKMGTKMIAVEASWADDLTKKAIDTAYAEGDTVSWIYAQPGDLVYAVVAASQTVAIGSALASSATAGELTVEASNTDARIVGLAEEAVTTTGARGRVKLRII